jgi:prepilin-type N-terminal cleavage/methylation domain-containing protein
VVSKGARGFSLIELVVVMAIILVVTAIAIPQIQRVQTRYRLDTSGRSVVGLLQQARLQAVRNNQPTYTQFDPSKPNLIYVNTDKSAYVPGNPGVVATNGGVTLLANVPAGLVLDQLNAFLGVGAGPGSAVVVETPNKPIGFNQRGLPCIGSLNGIPSVCVQQDGAQIPAFLWLMTTGQGDFEAVTVTPAGKIKAWQLAKGTTTWQ